LNCDDCFVPLVVSLADALVAGVAWRITELGILHLKADDDEEAEQDEDAQ
jgi:hypothetical protein